MMKQRVYREGSGYHKLFFMIRKLVMICNSKIRNL